MAAWIYICIYIYICLNYAYTFQHVYIHKRIVVGSAGTSVDLGIVVLKSFLKPLRLTSASGAFGEVMQAYHA